MFHAAEERPVETGDTIMMFIAGMAAGAALALMFAPTSGRQTREFLAQRSRRMAEKGRELVNEHGHDVAEAVEYGRAKASAVADRVSQAVERGKGTYRDALRRGQAAADQVSEELDGLARAAE